MTVQVPTDIANKVAEAWRAGKTILEMQALFGLSRQTLTCALRQESVDPRNWRERNRAVGKPVGPGSALKAVLSPVPELYGAGASLSHLADKFSTSRSSIRRALLGAGLDPRPRGRPVKGLPRA